MAPRNHDKDAARQARLVAEHAALTRAAQRQRVGMITAIALTAVIVVVVAIAISSSSSPTRGIQTGPGATATYRSIAAELSGIPQSGSTLGHADAPVTIQYFGDLECPYCAELTVGDGGSGLPELITGPVKRAR